MKDDFYTTGEVSKLLNISRATVSRKFDSGIFQGKKHPITGERLIGKESLITFMKKYKLSTGNIENDSQINVLLGSNNKQLQFMTKQAFLGDNQFNLDIVSSGYDALIKCSQHKSCVFLLDDELPDFDCKKAVETIKANENLTGIKIVCVVKSNDCYKEKTCTINDLFVKDDINSKIIKDKVTNILGISKTFQQEQTAFDHQRMWPRIPLGLPANVEVFLSDTPDNKEEGNTIIDNISLGGAYLSKINLSKNQIPFGSIRLMLNINNPPFEDLNEECKVVRLHSNGSLNAGVQFVDLNQRTKSQILKLYS
jgi:CheY-like chemotaxis protein